MAARVKQNASSINANLNQEYVHWLQNQSLPNSSGAMGIHEAETILSSRPGLDHAYQQRFIETKSSQMQDYISSSGMPTSMADVQNSYANAGIQNNASTAGMDNMRSQAASEGLGDAFKVDTSAKDKAAEKLTFVQDQIADQTAVIEKNAKAQMMTVNGKLGKK